MPRYNRVDDLENFTQSKEYPFLAISDDCRVVNLLTGSLLNPSICSGYLRFSVRVNGGNKGVQLHRLVAERFITKPEDTEYNQVNHIDGNKLNNDPHNLEWCTLLDNVKHANATGLRDSCYGVNHHACNTDIVTVHKACQYMTLHLSNLDIEMLLELPKGFCNDIRRGKRWKSISKDYDIPRKK